MKADFLLFVGILILLTLVSGALWEWWGKRQGWPE